MRAFRLLLLALVPVFVSLGSAEMACARSAHKGSHVAAKKHAPAKVQKKTATRPARHHRRAIVKKSENKQGHRHKTAARGHPRHGAS
jgi:hypothetical protein